MIALIPNGASFSIDDLEARLRQKFSKIQNAIVERSKAKHLQLRFTDWLFYVHFEDDPNVAIESQGIAKKKHHRDDWKTIAACERRIITYAMPDPNMDHFNHYIFVLEVLESLPEAYLFDPNDGKLWKSGETPPNA